jgi:glucans biosynthesis protein C
MDSIAISTAPTAAAGRAAVLPEGAADTTAARMLAGAAGPARRYDLDWLRVLAFMLLVPFHTGMFFVTWGWHVKNPQLTDGGLEVAMFFVSQWRLALLFFVSGAGVWFALRRRTPGEFARERLRRLLVPVAFGMLVVVPPQVYYERLSQGAGYGSYLEFLPHAFAGVYPEGNLSWHHLWFVVYLLVFSLVALPVLLGLRALHGHAVMGRVVERLARPGGLLLIAAPIVLGEVLLRPVWPSTHNLVADWANFTSYLLVFLAGFLLCSHDRLWRAMQEQRRGYLLLGTLLSMAIIGVWQAGHAPGGGYAPAEVGWRVARVLSAWSWVLALAGYARQYLNVRSRAVELANEAVYPFYILHQTVTVALAYHVGPWEIGIAPKFLILCIGTYGVTAALYLLIRSNPATRFVFGMKPARAPRGAEMEIEAAARTRYA